MSPRWTVEDLSFEMDDDQSSDPIVTLVIQAPGVVLMVMAEFSIDRSQGFMKLSKTHIHGATANGVGFANLKTIAQAVLEGMDLDEIIIEGGIRTTGACPGHIPCPFRFTRQIRPDPDA